MPQWNYGANSNSNPPGGGQEVTEANPPDWLADQLYEHRDDPETKARILRRYIRFKEQLEAHGPAPVRPEEN